MFPQLQFKQTRQHQTADFDLHTSAVCNNGYGRRCKHKIIYVVCCRISSGSWCGKFDRIRNKCGYTGSGPLSLQSLYLPLTCLCARDWVSGTTHLLMQQKATSRNRSAKLRPDPSKENASKKRTTVSRVITPRLHQHISSNITCQTPRLRTVQVQGPQN